MSFEADIHPAQTMILRELLFVPHASFSQLQKVTRLESDHFKFHLKRLVEIKYVIKTENSTYTLTRHGKEYANRLDTDNNTIEKQPKVSVVLIIENNQGKFLSQERLKQPFYGFWGRLTGKIRFGETILEAAARELMEESGLRADLRVSGFYHKMDYRRSDNSLLEDKLFIIIYGKNPRGNFITDAEGHHNEWLSLEELSKKEKCFESVPEITKLGQAEGTGFIEQKYYYESHEY